jgi:hypothetical protein
MVVEWMFDGARRVVGYDSDRAFVSDGLAQAIRVAGSICHDYLGREPFD